MAHARKKLPAFPGTGDLKFRGFKGPVAYEILGDPASLRPGPLRLRGSICTTPEVAEAAFREGEGELTLEGGSTFRLQMLGHSAGSQTAYFEMRV
ncbi:hypothetical protein [Phenylobacterium sp.]|jgi:hypothetical protein|uniref:hypothetical protein n=1 Tax=Phenylobacterium sp. TaxID=1871053 RepID=UPI002F95790D